ncbi:T9SS type A sorting domain-containing protein [Patescibacteria group bacterium]|nr:T9SS type A sorting domain-containing protein [Patescibacteria group bacterium]MBU1890143.1 T9SS type A sorting domain-containing protein [Patescibacteria group bacterium]
MRKLIHTGALLCLGLLMFSPAADSYYPTAQGSLAICYQPYEFALGFKGAQFCFTMLDQGYNVKYNRERNNPGTSPTVLLTDTDENNGFVNSITHGYAWLFYNTHGWYGMGVEVYGKTEAGKDARSAAMAAYQAAGWDTSGTDAQICSGSSVHGYQITARPQFIFDNFISNPSGVYNLSCNSNYWRLFWGDALCIMGYDGNTPEDGAAEAESFWKRANGNSGKDYRNMAMAASGHDIQVEGDGVVSPVVLEIEPIEGSDLEDDEITGYVLFDGPMLDTNPEALVFGCYREGEGGCLVVDAQWAYDDLLTYTIKPYRYGACQVVISAGAKSANGRALDGNTNPSGTDGHGPNRDCYIVEYNSTVNNPNLAASFDGAGAFRDVDGTHIWWNTGAEYGSINFQVYSGKNRNVLLDIVLAEGSPDLPHFYEIVVQDMGEYYEVVEVDNNPYTRDDTSRPFPISTNPPANLNGLRLLNQDAQFWPTPEPSEYSDQFKDSFQFRIDEVPDIVFYSSRQDFLDLIQPWGDWWSLNYGYTISYLLGSTNDPNEARAAATAVWQNAIDHHYTRFPDFYIVGEGNEGSEPQKVVVGHFYPEDTSGNCYWSGGCASDVMIVDCDNDSIPDLPWSRIVAYLPEEVEHSVQGGLDHLNGQNISPPLALIMSGDWFGRTEPNRTLELIQTWYTANNIPSVIKYDAAYDDPYDYTTRLNDFLYYIGLGLTEFIGIGDPSNRSIWPAFLCQKIYDPIFHMGLVPWPQRIIAEFPSCGVGDQDRNNPIYYPSLIKSWMTADPDNHSTIVYACAHMRGGYDILHTEWAKEYFSRRLNPMATTTMRTHWQALVNTAINHPEMKPYLLYAGSFGWGVKASGMGGGVGVEDERQHPFTLRSYPNPFMKQVSISFDLPRITRVELSIYDIQGRRVTQLMPPRYLEGGNWHIEWDGRDHNSRSLPAGVYFSHLQLDRRVYSGKLILIDQ